MSIVTIIEEYNPKEILGSTNCWNQLGMSEVSPVLLLGPLLKFCKDSKNRDRNAGTPRLYDHVSTSPFVRVEANPSPVSEVQVEVGSTLPQIKFPLEQKNNSKPGLVKKLLGFSFLLSNKRFLAT